MEIIEKKSNISVDTLFHYFKEFKKNKYDDEYVIVNDLKSDLVDETLNSVIINRPQIL